MRKLFLTLTLALALLASACGDDAADTDIGSDPEPTDDSLPVNPDPTPEPPISDPAEPDLDDNDEPILGAGPYPIADLTISVTLTDGGDSTISRLACLGDTATVTGDPGPVSADTMCLALHDLEVMDRVVNGEPADVACTEQYGGPEIASVTGTLDGAEIDTSFHRSNGCGISDWALLAAFLPAPA